ncbi:MAG: sodium:proton antiporter [Chloroflexota bacterium]|nr:MAG: sodium:proton antiporter [Chloroflexota bacterium]
MEHQETLLLAGIVGLGICCQWLAWRLKLPAILPLLGAGFLLGPVLNIIHPQELLGDLFFPAISLAVSIILFEGALTLKWQEVRHVAHIVRNLITIGALITWLGGGIAAHFILGLPWTLAILFGALIVVTGPTVIAPLLRNVRPIPKLASVLRWEGILIDPLGALLAVLIFNFIVAEGPLNYLSFRAFIGFLRIALIGTGAGLMGGYFVALVIRRYLVPDYLRDIMILAVVVSVFALSDSLQSESGLLAVTVMGLLLANLDLIQLRQIWHFKERISILLISSLFIVLAANITLADLAVLNWRSLLLVAVVIFVLRPVSVYLSALGSNLTRNERLFLSWIAPRGIVAAAVSSLFAFRLEELGYSEAPLLASLTFLVIVSTVVLQGGTAKLVARWLNVAEAEPQGFLIMGAHPFAQQLGLALQEEDFAVRLIDTNWENVRQAHFRGLDVYHGNILSEFAENDLDLSGLGRLLALTSNDEANALACLHLQDEFGSSNVYQLSPKSLVQHKSKQPSRDRLGRLFPGREITYEKLAVLVQEGAVIKKTQLTQQFTYADYTSYYGNNFVPLLLLRGKQAFVWTTDLPLTPQTGWTLLSLTLPSGPGAAVSLAPVEADTRSSELTS